LKKNPTENEKVDYSRYNIEELLLTSVSLKYVELCRELNSETQKKYSEDGYPLKLTTINPSTQDFLKPGLVKSAAFRQRMALVLKAYGKIKTVFATGEKYAFLNTFPGPIDTKAFGKILEKRFA